MENHLPLYELRVQLYFCSEMWHWYRNNLKTSCHNYFYRYGLCTIFTMTKRTASKFTNLCYVFFSLFYRFFIQFTLFFFIYLFICLLNLYFIFIIILFVVEIYIYIYKMPSIQQKSETKRERKKERLCYYYSFFLMVVAV